MAIIVDIDGTLADNKHRQSLVQTAPKQWDEFFKLCEFDSVIEPVAEVVRSMNRDHHILIVTGRPERYRESTVRWLRKHNVPFWSLYMREDDDHRPDHIIKHEILTQIRYVHDPILAIDDRPEVVNMWRENGIICLQNEPKI